MNATPVDVSAVPVTLARTAADFAACLDQVRVLAGPLSHREIENRGGRRLRRTKIGQVLAGELPRREFLAAYLEVCGVARKDWDPWFHTWARLVAQSHRSAPAHPAGRTVASRFGDDSITADSATALRPAVSQPVTGRDVETRAPTDDEPADRSGDDRDGLARQPTEHTFLERPVVRRTAVVPTVTGRTGPSESDPTVVLRVERNSEPDEVTRAALRAMRAERDDALRRLATLVEQNRALAAALEAQSTARAEAGRALGAAEARIAELTERDPHHGTSQSDEGQQNVVGPWQRTARPPSLPRLAVYTREEAEDLYGPATAPPGVLGAARGPDGG